MEVLKQVARLFGWKNAQYESLHEWNVDGWKVRVWRAQHSLGDAYTSGTQDIARVLVAFGAKPGHPLNLHAALMALPGVACVAIVDANGNGVSAYPDWH